MLCQSVSVLGIDACTATAQLSVRAGSAVYSLVKVTIITGKVLAPNATGKAVSGGIRIPASS
jgi:hypothetical protein